MFKLLKLTSGLWFSPPWISNPCCPGVPCTLEHAGLKPIPFYSLHSVVTTSHCCEYPLLSVQVCLALTTLKDYSGNRSRAETSGCNVMTGTLHGQVGIYLTFSKLILFSIQHRMDHIPSPLVHQLRFAEQSGP